MNITKVQAHWSVKEAESGRKLWKELDILVIKPTVSFKCMFFAMQCLLKCSHLPVWRLDSLRARDVTVKAGTAMTSVQIPVSDCRVCRFETWCWVVCLSPLFLAEAKWHAPSTKVLSSYKDRALQKEGSGKESPNKLSHVSLFLGCNSELKKQTNPKVATTKNYSGLTEINLKSTF